MDFLDTIQKTRHEKPQRAEKSLEELTAVLLDIGWSLAVIAEEMRERGDK